MPQHDPVLKVYKCGRRMIKTGTDELLPASLSRDTCMKLQAGLRACEWVGTR